MIATPRREAVADLKTPKPEKSNTNKEGGEKQSFKKPGAPKQKKKESTSDSAVLDDDDWTHGINIFQFIVHYACLLLKDVFNVCFLIFLFFIHVCLFFCSFSKVELTGTEQGKELEKLKFLSQKFNRKQW